MKFWQWVNIAIKSMRSFATLMPPAPVQPPSKKPWPIDHQVLCCISLVFPWHRGSFPGAVDLWVSHLPSIFHISSGRWFASWASSTRTACRQSVLAARSLLTSHWCGRSLPVNGTFRGGSKTAAADTSFELCADSRLGYRTYACSSPYLPNAVNNIVKIGYK